MGPMVSNSVLLTLVWALVVLDAMAKPFDVTGAPGPLAMGVSIGIATSDLGAAAELLRDADVAMYRAKAAGKSRSADLSIG
jgi:PleD family two-component response regulator